MNDYGFGNFIYELRTEKGLSQSELGSILGVSNKAVSKWETGEAKPRSGKLTLLAQTLGVSVEELLCGERKRSGREQTEEISFAIDLLAREYRRARVMLCIFIVCFFAAPVLMLLVMGIAFASAEENAPWAIALLVIFFVWHIVADAAVVVSFLVTVKRRRLLYASFPGRREEVFARTHIVPPAKKTGKLGLIVLVGIILMGVAVAAVLCYMKVIDAGVSEIIAGGVALTVGIGNITFIRLRMKRINGLMQTHSYEEAIKDAKFLLEVWLPSGRSDAADSLRLQIAVSYFSLSDDGNFRDYLGEITMKKFLPAKGYWKCVDAFVQRDAEALRAEYGAFFAPTGENFSSPVREERGRGPFRKGEREFSAFYGERARLLLRLAEGNAEAKDALLPLIHNPRLVALVGSWSPKT